MKTVFLVRDYEDVLATFSEGDEAAKYAKYTGGFVSEETVYETVKEMFRDAHKAQHEHQKKMAERVRFYSVRPYKKGILIDCFDKDKEEVCTIACAKSVKDCLKKLKSFSIILDDNAKKRLGGVISSIKIIGE